MAGVSCTRIDWGRRTHGEHVGNAPHVAWSPNMLPKQLPRWVPLRRAVFAVLGGIYFFEQATPWLRECTDISARIQTPSQTGGLQSGTVTLPLARRARADNPRGKTSDMKESRRHGRKRVPKPIGYCMFAYLADTTLYVE